MKEKLIPFDLQRCIAGEEVVTRDGRPYKFGAYNEDVNEDQVLLGWIGKLAYSHKSSGQTYDINFENDLFMKPKKRAITIYVYEGQGGFYATLSSNLFEQNWTLKETIEREYPI